MENKFFPAVRIVILKDKYPKLFSFLKELKELSSNNDCDFKNNICKRNKLYGCCSTCMKCYGFYKYDSFLLGDKKEILSYFEETRSKEKYGFLNLIDNPGCSLPRYLRSNPCNIFRCFDQDQNEIKKEAIKYDELISSINSYFMIKENCENPESVILSDLVEENKNLLKQFNGGIL